MFLCTLIHLDAFPKEQLLGKHPHVLKTLLKPQLKGPVLWEGNPAFRIHPFKPVTLGGASAEPHQECSEGAKLKWELRSARRHTPGPCLFSRERGVQVWHPRNSRGNVFFWFKITNARISEAWQSWGRGGEGSCKHTAVGAVLCWHLSLWPHNQFGVGLLRFLNVNRASFSALGVV